MERTPSPPRRVRTPPAPHHGAKNDNYEPFSPRRSSRVAAQANLHQGQTSPARRRVTRDVTPTNSSQKSTYRPSNHTLSPPSSPISPTKHQSPRSTRRLQYDQGPTDSESEHAAPTPARRFLSAMAPHGMLPTPVKTPRKRAFQSEESLGPTARVLFQNRPATIEEAMPTPRKVRQTKNSYTLESFTKQLEQPNGKIEVYTDSKERVPTRDDDEDNPFATKKGKGKAKAIPQNPRNADEATTGMFDAVDRQEGMVYLFRGKKILRKFHTGPPSDGSDPGRRSYDAELRRVAGSEAKRPLLRSDIKPKLLFQEEIKRQRIERGDADEDDEEAVTDIEVPITTPSRRAHKGISSIASIVQEATPPSTTRVKRQISFESWSRVKPSARGSSSASRDGKKRSGPPLESSADKRARSEHSSSAMSIDDL